jgi:hypothetical protein
VGGGQGSHLLLVDIHLKEGKALGSGEGKAIGS